MRKGCIALLFFLFVAGNLSIIAQESKINYRDPQTWLLGYFVSDDLLAEPHSLWFNQEFDSYEIDNEAFIELGNYTLENIEVLVVLGTWCPDSRREVPRFIKICELIGLNQDKITWMGTDSYKEAPIEGYEDLDIERVPTFIFYYNKNEIGRIIEYPKASLERDMVNIFKDLESKKL